MVKNTLAAGVLSRIPQKEPTALSQTPLAGDCLKKNDQIRRCDTHGGGACFRYTHTHTHVRLLDERLTDRNLNNDTARPNVSFKMQL